MNKLNKITNLIPTYYRALRSKSTPKAAKLAMMAAIFYAIMPADIISDVIPVVGWLDDAMVMTILLYIAGKMIPDSIANGEENNVIDDADYKVVE